MKIPLVLAPTGQANVIYERSSSTHTNVLFSLMWWQGSSSSREHVCSRIWQINEGTMKPRWSRCWEELKKEKIKQKREQHPEKESSHALTYVRPSVQSMKMDFNFSAQKFYKDTISATSFASTIYIKLWGFSRTIWSFNISLHFIILRFFLDDELKVPIIIIIFLGIFSEWHAL